MEDERDALLYATIDAILNVLLAGWVEYLSLAPDINNST
jgi:hypothetical protein